MGEGHEYFGIILFAMIAAFLILRLRSVLGRRPDNERRPPVMRRNQPAANNVVALGDRSNQVAAATDTPAEAVARGLGRVRSADPSFDPAGFLEGARSAFDIIVGAFAAGDESKLRPLLSDEVYTPFAAAIEERRAAQETLETRVIRLGAVEISDAALDGRMARITVKFVSDQINVTRAHDGSIVDGNPEQPSEKTDFWTFARDTRSSDPNWTLVATSSG